VEDVIQAVKRCVVRKSIRRRPVLVTPAQFTPFTPAQ
jgi:hypothetical protein